MKNFLKMCEKWHTSRPFGGKRRVPQESLSKMYNFDCLKNVNISKLCPTEVENPLCQPKHAAYPLSSLEKLEYAERHFTRRVDR